MRIFRPRKSSGSRSGRLAENCLKPLSQYARPLMPRGSSLANSALPISPSVTRSTVSESGNRYGKVENFELAHTQRAELRHRWRQHLHRTELQRLHLLAILVQLAVGIEFDLDPARGVFFGELPEFFRGLALGRIVRHHVAELDDDRIGCEDAEAMTADSSAARISLIIFVRGWRTRPFSPIDSISASTPARCPLRRLRRETPQPRRCRAPRPARRR